MTLKQELFDIQQRITRNPFDSTDEALKKVTPAKLEAITERIDNMIGDLSVITNRIRLLEEACAKKKKKE